jgi:hypothetical protein
MPCGVPSTGDASKPRNSTSGWNGSASVSLKLTLLACWSSAPSTLAAPLRVRSLDLKVWMLPGILSLSTLKPGTGVTPTTTISSRACVSCGACCATTAGEIAVNVVASARDHGRYALLRVSLRLTGKTSPACFIVDPRSLHDSGVSKPGSKFPRRPGIFPGRLNDFARPKDELCILARQWSNYR